MKFERAALLILAMLIVVSKARAKQCEHTRVESRRLAILKALKSTYIKESYHNKSLEPLNGGAQYASACVWVKLEGLQNSNREQFVTTYCPQMREAIDCLSPVFNEIQERLNEDGLEMVEILMNFLSRAVELSCKNEGEILFDHGADQNCRQHLANDIIDCLSISFSKRKRCKDLGKMRKCLVKKLNECDSPRLIEFFDLLYQPAMDSPNCMHILLIHMLNIIGIVRKS